jgi:tryptophan-rich sensory protein
MKTTFNTCTKLFIAIVLCEIAGIIISTSTIHAITTWYIELKKPTFGISGWVFSPIWTTLFFLMGISLYLAWDENWRIIRKLSPKRWNKSWNQYSRRLWTGSWQKINTISIFIVQFLLMILWPMLFFGFKEIGFAFFELIALWIATIYLIINFYRISKSASFLLIPQLLCIMFAIYLNGAIWMMSI